MLHAILLFLFFIALVKTDLAEFLFALSLVAIGGYQWVS